MSNLGINIKKIRVAKKLSQSDFAAMFNLSRAAIGSYEEGRAEAKIDTLIQISEHFQISLDKLVKTKLTINDILHFNEKKYVNESLQNDTISYISFDEFQNFFENNKNTDNQKLISLPDLNSEFTAFEYFSKKNKIIECIFDNSILICKRKFLMKELVFKDRYYFVYSNGVHSAGKVSLIENNKLQIKKLNDEFDTFEINNALWFYEIISVVINDFSAITNIENNNILKKIKEIIS